MKTREQLIKELRYISEMMIDIGAELNYYAGLDSELAEKGIEMIGAGKIAAQWADKMEQNK